MSLELKHFAAAFTGSLLQEVLHWYEAKGKLDEPEYKALITSSAYWIIASLMVILCSVGCIFWYDSSTVSSRDYLVTGAAFGAIFKKAVSGLQNNRKRRLGATSKAGELVRRYFSV